MGRNILNFIGINNHQRSGVTTMLNGTRYALEYTHTTDHPYRRVQERRECFLLEEAFLGAAKSPFVNITCRSNNFQGEDTIIFPTLLVYK